MPNNRPHHRPGAHRCDQQRPRRTEYATLTSAPEPPRATHPHQTQPAPLPLFVPAHLDRQHQRPRRCCPSLDPTLPLSKGEHDEGPTAVVAADRLDGAVGSGHNRAARYGRVPLICGPVLPPKAAGVFCNWPRRGCFVHSVTTSDDGSCPSGESVGRRSFPTPSGTACRRT